MCRSISPGILLCLVSLFGNAQSAWPNVLTTPGADEVQVVDAVKTMYIAATTDDLAKFHSVSSPNFYAFDVGRKFTGDALMELITGLHAAGNIYVWQVTEPEVHIYRDTALITYVNRGSLKNEAGTKSLVWLESAVLRKEKGRWLILFLHSTRVP